MIWISNDMDDIYKNIEEYNPNKKHKILTAFDYLTADILRNKDPTVTDLFIKGRKLNISLVFYHATLFCCTKKYWKKFYTLLYYENSKQTRTSINCIQSFIRY